MPSHEECRRKVCLLCMGKSKEVREITSSTWEIIEKYFIDGINKHDERLPNVICNTCRKITSEYGRGIFTRSIKLYDHTNIGAAPRTRFTVSNCHCIVCSTASSVPKNISMKIGVSALPDRTPSGRPPSSQQPMPTSSGKPKAIKLCSFCLTTLARGCPHECTKTMRVENLQGLAQCGTPKLKEKVAAGLVDQKLKAAGSATITLARSAGKSLVLTHGVSNLKRKLFTAEDMSSIQTDMNLSNTQIFHLAGHIRTATASRSCIQTQLKTELHDRNHQLDHLFSLSSQTDFVIVEHSDGNVIKTKNLFVFCNDVNDFIQEVQQKHKKAYTNTKIGIDGGGGFFKVCLTLHNIHEKEERNRRHCYSDGIGSNKKLDSSVKKLFIIGLVPNIKENYQNALTVWLQLQLDNISLPYTIATDLKLANILCGLMSHGSNHPCTWCTVCKTDLLQGSCGDLRTLGSLRKLYSSWYDAGLARTSAKHYGNVIHSPIFKDVDEKLVLDIIPPPELHLLIGPVCTMFNGLKKAWPKADEWANLCNVEKEQYYGGVFNGNSCKKLLKNIAILTDSLRCEKAEYCKAFQDFSDAVDACYAKVLNNDYETKIGEFANSYKNMDYLLHSRFIPSFTTKDFCKRHHLGLGIWSEQASESVHADFNITWERYAISRINEKYGEHLLSAVRDYSGKHI